MRLESIFFALRILGAFISVSSLFGLLMFLSTNHPASVGVSLSLLLLSLMPTAKMKSHLGLLIIAIVFVIVSYTVAGVPFLNTHDDIVARLLHVVALLLIIVFVLRAAIMAVRDRTKKKVKL